MDKILELPSHIIVAITTIFTFFVGLFSRNMVETLLVKSKLNTEHRFNQRKKVKETLSKYKIQLLSACEEFNHRMWNFSKNHSEKWHYVEGKYNNKDNYYFHSFVYRFLAVFAWVKIIEKEMIYFDTTIADKEDLDFVKFLKIFSKIFCDLNFIEDKNIYDGKKKDHFYKNDFDHFPDILIEENRVKTYSSYLSEITTYYCNREKIDKLYEFFDSLDPLEKDGKRWDRLHFFHIIIIIFLNEYGYDFQKTNKEKMKSILEKPKKSDCLKYFELLKEYKLHNNNQVKKYRKLISPCNIINI